MTGNERVTREEFLRRGGVAGAALLGGSMWAAAPAAARRRRRGRGHDPATRNPAISLPENHSFDSYFGFAPEVQRRGFGPPPGFAQPDDTGVLHPVFHQTALRTADPDHSWAGSHLQYDGGGGGGLFRPSRGGG